MIDLARLRKMVGVTQAELADALGTSQGQISRMERQQDMLFSTLESYLRALGVSASLVVEIHDQTVAYDLIEGQEDR